jgi:DNA-binding GntR family transcriptional regulator
LVISRLRDAIVRGAFQPGERLRHESLARRFDVSTMPVREALAALEIEGVVTNVPNCGASVTRYRADELREIYEIRANLEKTATLKAAPRLISEDFATLTRICTAMDKSFSDAARFTELNGEFHTAIYAQSRQHHLCQLIESLRARTRHYLCHLTASPERFAAAQSEHRKMVAMLESGRAEEAANFMFHHVYRVGETIARLLESSPVAEAGLEPAAIGGQRK